MWKKGREEICDVVHHYFEGLFTSDSPEDMDAALEGLSLCVSNEMNVGLVSPPSGEEVREALLLCIHIKLQVLMAFMLYSFRNSDTLLVRVSLCLFGTGRMEVWI